MMGIKIGPVRSVGFEYASDIEDGKIKPCAQGTRDVQAGHPGYIHTESSTLDKMLRDYLFIKFPSVDSVGRPKIRVVLKDFWLEQYSNDSTGSQVLAVLGGGEVNIIVVANLELLYEMSGDGPPVTRTVRVSGDSVHVAGIGTGTSTSNIHGGKESIEFRVADAMNNANNKAIVLFNQFLEANQL